MDSPSVACRLSNGVDDAEPFTASDSTSLRTGAELAWRRYQHRHPRNTAALELQVAGEPSGWYVPLRGSGYVRVLVSTDLLARRPPDDWTEIWTWVEASRDHGQRLRAFAGEVADGVERAVIADELTATASEMGRRGGQIGGKSTSEAKQAASRANGAKGGRPRRPPEGRTE